MGAKRTKVFTNLQSKAITVILLTYATKLIFEVLISGFVVITTLLRVI